MTVSNNPSGAPVQSAAPQDAASQTDQSAAALIEQVVQVIQDEIESGNLAGAQAGAAKSSAAGVATDPSNPKLPAGSATSGSSNDAYPVGLKAKLGDVLNAAQGLGDPNSAVNKFFAGTPLTAIAKVQGELLQLDISSQMQAANDQIQQHDASRQQLATQISAIMQQATIEQNTGIEKAQVGFASAATSLTLSIGAFASSMLGAGAKTTQGQAQGKAAGEFLSGMSQGIGTALQAQQTLIDAYSKLPIATQQSIQTAAKYYLESSQAQQQNDAKRAQQAADNFASIVSSWTQMRSEMLTRSIVTG